jgi:N-acetylmuramoyl-L-alanine amidase
MSRTPDPILSALSPFDLVLVTLWGEVRGEPIDGQVAVANVLRNRVADGRWGDDYHSVCLAWAQFSCLWPTLGGPNFQRVITFARRVKDIEIFTLPERQLRLVVQGLFGNALVDNVNRATHYYAKWIPAPPWAMPPARQVAQRGRHLFFAGVR